MRGKSYLYFFNYDSNESEICKLESKYLFREEEKGKLLLSEVKIEPSWSAFIKKRLDVLGFSEVYEDLLEDIRKKAIRSEGFKIEYIVLEDDSTSYDDRLSKLRDFGYCIEGDPDYHHPVQTFALCMYKGLWYFGELIKNGFDWHKHNQKPCSYSNSLSAAIAKSLINIASQGNLNSSLLDGCCGVGTILLEASFAGFSMDGCEINEKIAEDARKNLAYFNYSASVYHSDIKDITTNYDAVILDLPYNLFSHADDDQLLHIIQSAARLSRRILIVSLSDVSPLIAAAGLQIIEAVSLTKRRKANVTRQIWLCN
jgi:tRNA (guanine10-N2)-dimethyltransferase